MLNLNLRQVAKFVFYQLEEKIAFLQTIASKKTFASPLEGYISAVSQPISNFQKALEKKTQYALICRLLACSVKKLLTKSPCDVFSQK